MRIRVSKPSPAMVVASLALATAMGGTSYAATQISGGQIKNNSVRSADIKNNSLRSVDIKNNTLRGRDIRESTLGSVPKVDNFVTFNVAMNRGDARTKLVKIGPVTLYGTCTDDPNNAGEILGSVTAETTAAHTYTYDDNDLNPGEVADVETNNGVPNAGDDGNYESYEPMFFSGEAGGSFDDDGEAAGIIIGGPGAECRFVGSIPEIPAG